jgi:hypothetical protein
MANDHFRLTKTHDKRLIVFLEWVLQQSNAAAYGDVIRMAAKDPPYLRQCMEFSHLPMRPRK